MGPADVLCDTISKKHSAINYHAVREVVAAGIIRVGK